MSAGLSRSSLLSSPLSSKPISVAIQRRLTEAALACQPSVRLVRLPLMASDGDCTESVGTAGGPDEEPPAKRSKTKIIPYKLKDSDKKMVYDSGTVIYTEEFKRSVWDYLLAHSLADGEARYPEISHSVLYKWRRKAHEQQGCFVPQRKSLMADLKKDRDKDDNDTSQSSNSNSTSEKDRRHSEQPKVPKLKISLKLTTKDETKEAAKESKEPKVKQITALSDDLTVEKKIRVVIFALQNSTQKAAEHFGLRAGDVHSFMSQNVIRRMAVDRIRKKVTKGIRTGDFCGRTRAEIEEIVNLARRTSVERASRQYGLREGQVLQWMRNGIPQLAIEHNRVTNGDGAENGTNGTSNSSSSRSSNGLSNDDEDEDSEYLDFMLKVIDIARKQTLSRASKTFQVPPSQVITWMRQFFNEDEIRRVQNSDEELVTADDRRDGFRATRTDTDELDKSRRTGGGGPLDSSSPIKLSGRGADLGVSANSNGTTTLHSVSRSPFKNTRHSSRAVELALSTGLPTTMGDQLESMEDDQPLSLLPHVGLNNGYENGHHQTAPHQEQQQQQNHHSNETDSNNNDTSPFASIKNLSDGTVGLVNGSTASTDISGKNRNGGLNGVAAPQQGKALTLSLEQIETARELGITMRCLSRWLQCREHFSKLRNSKMVHVAGDALKELLSFRIEAVNYAHKEGRIYAASVFRVTLSELHEWTGRREAYLRALGGCSCPDPRALQTIDCASELLLHERGKLDRAEAIANRIGIDLAQVNRFIQQLYSTALLPMMTTTTTMTTTTSSTPPTLAKTAPISVSTASEASPL